MSDETYTAGRSVTVPLRPTSHVLSVPLERGVEVASVEVERNFETEGHILIIRTRYANWWIKEESARKHAAGEYDPVTV